MDVLKSIVVDCIEQRQKCVGSIWLGVTDNNEFMYKNKSKK